MRFSNLQRFFCFHQAAAEGNTNKTDDIIPYDDGSATTTDDDSSTSSNIFINETSNSGNKNSCKSPPCKRYPLLYSTSNSSTTPSKAVPVRIQLALSMFMNRPIPQNWSHLVSLLRGENVHDEGRNRTLDRLEKSLADELIVYEAEVDDVEEELGKDRGEMAVEGESVMKLLAPDSPHLVNSSVYAESVIYESDEDDGEGDESIIGLGLLPDMYDLDEIGSVDYVPNESDEEQKEEHVLHNDDGKEEGRYREWGAITAMKGKSPAASFVGQIDWPFPATAVAAAAPSRASTAAQQSTTKNPPSFANKKAKAYVILWERRIRRFDQNQVNVVQKSVHPRNRSTEESNMADSRREEEAPIANTNAGMKNDNKDNKVAPRKRIIRPTVNPTPPPLPEARDEVNQYYEKQHRSTNINCSPIVVRPIASTSTTALRNTNVRDKVMNWENKLKSTHPDEVQM